MSLNISKYTKFIPKAVIISICATILIYQTNLLLTVYFSGQTVVSLNVGRLQSETLPAFTLCLSDSISLKRLAKLKPEYQGLYDEYEDINRFYQEMYYSNTNSSKRNESDYKLINEKYLKARKRYLNLFKFNFNSTTLFDLMNVWTIPFEEEYMNYSLVIEGVTYENYSSNNVNLVSSFQSDQFEPVQSLRVEWRTNTELDVSKCFTFFSALNSKWRHYDIDLDKIKFQVLISTSIMQMESYNSKLYFSIHSSNVLPDLNDQNFFSLTQYKNHTILYSEVNTELLGNGYDTNCYNYDLDYKYANFNMRSDCLLSCYQTMLGKECEHDDFISSEKLLRKELIDQNIDKIVDNNLICLDKYNREVMAQCSNKCQLDCKFKYYIWNQLDKYDQHVGSYGRNRPLLITILHNRLPDVQVKYLPQNNLISIFCNFGGLLGMWLGLSFIAIFDNCLHLMRRLFSKRTINLTKIENTNIIYNYSPRNFLVNQTRLGKLNLFGKCLIDK